MIKHTCVKPACGNSYESEEVDAYYCPGCTKANVALAKKIDAEIAARPKRSRVSAVQEHEAACNMNVRGMKALIVK